MFRSLIIRELYVYLTKVIFMLKHPFSFCTAHNTHAALRHAATSPNIHNDVILDCV